MNIALIAAMPEEFRALARCLERGEPVGTNGLKGCRCRAAGHDILLVESGMGFDNAARAAKAVIEATRPDLLISAGFCGGINPELRVGDVVVATALTVVTEAGLREVPVEIPAVGSTFVTRLTAQGSRVYGGLFAGTPSIVPKKRLGELLPSFAPTPVVEMESAAIAAVAGEHGIPFLALRSVSDPADEELGFTLDEFCDSRLRIRPHRVLLTCLRKPRIIPQLIRLAGNSRVAAAALTAAMERLLPLL
jgi:adenosylhomocysteine nucleosidase